MPSLKTIPRALACGSVRGRCLTWAALWQMRAHEALGAAWPRPRAGAQTCGSGAVLTQTGSYVLGLAGPGLQAGSWDACYHLLPLPEPKAGTLVTLTLPDLEQLRLG